MGSHAALHSLPSSHYGSILSISFGIGTLGSSSVPALSRTIILLLCSVPQGYIQVNASSRLTHPARMICFYQLPSVCIYCQFSEAQGRVDWDHHLTVGLQGRCIPQLNMKAHSLLSFTARLQLSKQCLPSWLSSQAWFLVIRVTVCLSAFPALFSS